MNMLYTGPLYMGENQERMEVVWDTGSDWLVIEGSDCPSCLRNTYDYTDEYLSSFNFVKKSWGERNYGSASLTGVEAKDHVCLG